MLSTAASLTGSALETFGMGRVVEAVKRVTALALVDASLTAPSTKPVCDAALDKLALTPSDGKPFMYYRPSAKPAALLILCHPSRGSSLCRSLADLWEEALKRVGVEVRRVDLPSGEGTFSLSGEDQLRAALQGKDPYSAVPEEVRELQTLVEECKFLIFVHPIFWFDVPSQLKGFEESVLSSGFAFRKLPSHWLLNRAAGVIQYVPVARTVMRRYAAYGMLRDKQVFVTRTQGGPAAGMGIFGHEATSLESALQFCGAWLASVDVVAEVDDISDEDFTKNVLPGMAKLIDSRCEVIAASATSMASLENEAAQAKLASLEDHAAQPERALGM